MQVSGAKIQCLAHDLRQHLHNCVDEIGPARLSLGRIKKGSYVEHMAGPRTGSCAYFPQELCGS